MGSALSTLTMTSMELPKVPVTCAPQGQGGPFPDPARARPAAAWRRMLGVSRARAGASRCRGAEGVRVGRRRASGTAARLGGDVEGVADARGLRERQAVHGPGQQVAAAAHAAGRDVRALLHPAHHLRAARLLSWALCVTSTAAQRVAGARLSGGSRCKPRRAARCCPGRRAPEGAGKPARRAGPNDALALFNSCQQGATGRQVA